MSLISHHELSTPSQPTVSVAVPLPFSTKTAGDVQRRWNRGGGGTGARAIPTPIGGQCSQLIFRSRAPGDVILKAYSPTVSTKDPFPP